MSVQENDAAVQECVAKSPPEQLGPVSVASRAGRRRLRDLPAIAVAAAITVSSCAKAAVIDSAVAPVVERVRTAPAPLRWQFSYQPDSASPYLACLDGIDEATGTIDVATGAVTVQPNRAAPPIVITDSSFMVAAGPDPTGPWDEVSWGTDDDEARLVAVFGEVLAGYIATGTRAPDPNTTALAAIDIAADVSPAVAPSGLVGVTFGITLDPDRYLDELTANDAKVAEDERDRIPSLTVTADDKGRVTALVVDATSTASADQSAHRDRYVITATYDVAPVEIPAPAQRRPASLAAIGYPAPADSCRFGS